MLTRSLMETYELLVSLLGLNLLADLDDIEAATEFHFQPSRSSLQKKMARHKLAKHAESQKAEQMAEEKARQEAAQIAHLQKMAQEEAKQKTMLVEASLKEKATHSFANLIDSSLPHHLYSAKRADAPTIAALRSKLKEVKYWPVLRSSVRRNQEQMPPEKLKHTPLPPDHYKEMVISSSGTHISMSEPEMYGVFDFTLFRALNQLLTYLIITLMQGNYVSCSEGSRQEKFTSIRTEIRNQQDPQNPSDQGGVVTDCNRNIVAVWEIERDSLLQNGDNLVSCHNDDICTYVKETIHQQVGHHIIARCRFGFISMY
jgi:hypothetical protein